MADADFDAIFLVEVLGQMLGGIDRAMLSAGASEGEHQVGESALQITLYVGIGQPIDTVEEGEIKEYDYFGY